MYIMYVYVISKYVYLHFKIRKLPGKIRLYLVNKMI